MQVFTWKRISSFALAVVAAAMMLWPSLPPEQAWAGTQTESGPGSTGLTVSDEQELRQAVENGQREIIVEGELTLSGTLVIPPGAETVLRGAEDGSSSIKANTANSVLIDVAGTLTTQDLTVDAASKGTVLKVEEGGIYRMEGGTVLENGSSKTGEYGGGIWNKGDCQIVGGTVTGCYASYGGGIANQGTLTMNGGSIVNCSAKRGGGIYNKGPEAEVTIDGTDAEISSNVASYSMNTMNTSDQGVSCGGGIYIQSGSVTLKDGNISNNQALADTTPAFGAGTEGLGGAIGCGGGVYVDNYGGSFVMAGGTVSGNEAERASSSIAFLSEAKREMRGGGVFVQGGTDETAGKQAGTFTMTGGTVTGNYSRGVGSGVCVAEMEYSCLNKETSHCPGSAGFFMGGNAVIEGNVNDDCYLCDGVLAVITESFANARIAVTVEGQAVDTVLAEYAQGVDADDSDCKVFTLRSSAEQRTVKLRELPPDGGQDGEDARYQLYMAGLDISEYGTALLADGPTVYTGKAVEPEVIRVEFFPGSGKTLVLSEGADYQVGYEYESGKNTEPGPAKVVVTGIGNYSGQITVPFEIQKRPMDDPAVEVTKNELATVSYTYDGKEKTPARNLIALEDTVAGSPLLYNEDYAIGYEGNVNAGTAYVLLNGKGVHYSGTRKLAFTIGPASLDGCSISYPKSCQYTGQAVEPAVTVKDVTNGLGELQEGTDYTCAYRDNINVGTGTAEVIVTGKGNYAGTRTLKFSILAASEEPDTPAAPAAAQQISGPKASYQKVYGAKAFSLNAKASGGGTLTYTSSDTDVVKVDSKGRVTVKGTGKATVTVKAAAVGQQYKACEKKVTVTVAPKKASGVSVSNSKARKLAVKWKKDKQATGYEVQYSTSKKFKKSNTKTKNVGKNTTAKKTVSKLKKGKTYCVRVRSYKKYGKEKLYGAWSSICRIKITK